MTSHCQTRVVMADQHALLAESLGIVFEMRRYSYHVVPIPNGTARTDQVLRRLLRLRPDVLLVNADLGRSCNGAALIAPMVGAGAAVVVITENTDEARWGECLAQGARTVLSKSVSLGTVVSTVRRVSHREPVLERAERERLIGVYRSRAERETVDRARLADLSPQEGEVLRLMMAGRSVAEISRVRVVAEGTVRTQVKAIHAKLQVNSQLAAVAAARRGGWDCAGP